MGNTQTAHMPSRSPRQVSKLQIISAVAWALLALWTRGTDAGGVDLAEALASTSVLSVIWEDCGSNADAKITSLTPDTIPLGATTDFTGGGDLNKDITGGTYKMTMTGVGGVTLLNCNGDAAKPSKCSIGIGPVKVGTAAYGGIQLPQKSGKVTLPKIVSVALPEGLPSFATKTVTTLTVTDSDGAEAFCAKISTAPKQISEMVQPIVDLEDSWQSNH